MAKSLLSIKSKKKPAARQPKYTDTKFTGDEPTWQGFERLKEDQQRAAWHRAFYFYNYYNSPGDMRKYVVQYGQKHLGWGKQEIAAFNECDDNRVGQTICTYCKCRLDGAPELEADFIARKFEELLSYGNQQLAKKQQQAKATVAKRTIQDHMREKQHDLVGELEHMYDVWMTTDAEMPDFVAFFREQNMPQQFVSRVQSYYAEMLEELVSSQEKTADEQLREGYKWVKKTDVKRIAQFHTALADALATYGKVKKATRAVRKARPVSKEKVVKNVKYQTEYKELNLVSINPVDIIGCQQLWVYNTKTRKLGRYTAAEDSKQLTIKGSTIIGYDEKTSTAKTLRKPPEQLKAFAGAGKVVLRSFLENIKTTEVQLNGRLNADTILLKSVR
jgi:hypothetical protein